MRYDAEILNEFRQIIDALRQKKMTRQEALRRLREIGDEIELDQWQIIEDLRKRAPENQRELARELTDLLAAELRLLGACTPEQDLAQCEVEAIRQ
jgi:hypothetical protein